MPIYLGVFILLFGCNRQHSDINGKIFFHYNQTENITSLDPAFAKNQSNIWAIDHIFNTLIQLDSQLNVTSCLAKSWKISPNGLEYQFTLRNDVFFHDNPCFPSNVGRKMTAKDFEFSFNRIIDDEVTSPGSWIFKDRIDSIVPFKALNDSIFIIKLAKPFVPFLFLLTNVYCSVVPHEAISIYGKQFREHPVGTGPFYLKKWEEGQAMILLKNQKYFEFDNQLRLPYLDGIRISFINDKKTAFLQLLNENLDFVNGFDPGLAYEILSNDGQLRQKYKDKIKIHIGPFLNSEYLGINLELAQKSILHSVDFRKALNYGFDRIEMLKLIKRGLGTPAESSFIPFGLPSYDSSNVKGYRYNIQKALSNLEKSGYLKKPFVEREVLSLFTPKSYIDYCLYIAKSWEKLGVRVKIELVEASTLREMMLKGQVLFFRASWLADYPDGENFMTVFYSKNDAPPNYTRFKNEKFDELYQKCLIEIDLDKRLKYFQEMDNILIEQSPVIFLFYDKYVLFTSKNIIDLDPNPLNILKLKRVRKVNKKLK